MPAYTPVDWPSFEWSVKLASRNETARCPGRLAGIPDRVRSQAGCRPHWLVLWSSPGHLRPIAPN